MQTLDNQIDTNKKTFHHPDPVEQSVIAQWLFADVLPWQQSTWQYLTRHTDRLPHAMLFAGNAGTGKRAFVYRFVAWLLCQQKHSDPHNMASACGTCDSCQWLIAGNHPNLYQLPKPSTPASYTGTKINPSKSKSPSQPIAQAPSHQPTMSIKIDDIRALQPFVVQSSAGLRIVVIHQADAMTVAASNALLKTLEEPAENVIICLISDSPSQLLPTIRSRLQAFSVSHVTPQQSLALMQKYLPQTASSTLEQASSLSGYAPFVALQMLDSEWYQHRQTWINSWQAVRSHQRTPLQASDYWQRTLALTDFLYLSQSLLVIISQFIMGLAAPPTDIDIKKLQPLPELRQIQHIQQTITQIWQDRQQHIQDKLCYDKIFSTMKMI
jgi:DNA polymerase-3 subunit delta'